MTVNPHGVPALFRIAVARALQARCATPEVTVAVSNLTYDFGIRTMTGELTPLGAASTDLAADLVGQVRT